MKQITRLGLVCGIALLAFMLVPVNQLQAQPDGNIGIELTPTAGYMWGGKLRGYNGELNVGDGFTYGITISKAFAPGTWGEFSWNGMNTTGTLRDYYDIGNNENFDMKINYYLLSATQDWRTGSDMVIPFGIIGVGASSHAISGSTTQYLGNSTEWFFSMAFGLGAKIHFNHRIGIRLQGRMLMPVTFGGVNLWCGTGGCGSGVYTSSSILQGDLSGALVFRF